MTEQEKGLRKVASQLRKDAQKKQQRKLANTARTASAVLGLEHFKRILGLPKHGT